MVPISVFASRKSNLRQTPNFISNNWCVKKIIRRELERLVFLQKKSDTFRNWAFSLHYAIDEYHTSLRDDNYLINFSSYLTTDTSTFLINWTYFGI